MVQFIALSQRSRRGTAKINVRFFLIFVNRSIEQDADIVAFLYRDDYYDRAGEDDGMFNNTVEVIIEKNRSGARGQFELISKRNKFLKHSKERGSIR